MPTIIGLGLLGNTFCRFPVLVLGSVHRVDVQDRICAVTILKCNLPHSETAMRGLTRSTMVIMFHNNSGTYTFGSGSDYTIPPERRD